MFERFFNKESKESEDPERILAKIANEEFSKTGVHGSAIHMAFRAVQEENIERDFGLTNNHLLNIVKNCAYGQSDVGEDLLYGGPGQTFATIDQEIKRIRDGLSEEEQRG